MFTLGLWATTLLALTVDPAHTQDLLSDEALITALRRKGVRGCIVAFPE
jgi:hypothetical protein